MLHDGQADTATAQAVGRTLAHMHAHAAARATELAPLFDSEAIFFDIRLEPYLLATAQRHPDWRRAAGAGGADAGEQAHAGARRRQPEEHPGRPHGPGAAGRRMRLLGRPGLRPGLLPEPPAAEGPVDAGVARRLPGRLAALAEPTWPAWTGSRAPRSSARRGTAARPAAGARGRQVAGRIPLGRHPTRRRAPSGAAAAAATRDPSGRHQRRLARRNSNDDRCHHHPQLARPPRVGQPRPPHRGSRGAPARRRHAAAPSCRPAPAKGSREALELRDGGEPSAAWTCSAPSAT
jgi:hypothetical protein